MAMFLLFPTLGSAQSASRGEGKGSKRLRSPANRPFPAQPEIRCGPALDGDEAAGFGRAAPSPVSGALPSHCDHAARTCARRPGADRDACAVLAEVHAQAGDNRNAPGKPEAHCRALYFLSLSPAPPFSAMNSTPAAFEGPILTTRTAPRTVHANRSNAHSGRSTFSLACARVRCRKTPRNPERTAGDATVHGRL